MTSAHRQQDGLAVAAGSPPDAATVVDRYASTRPGPARHGSTYPGLAKRSLGFAPTFVALGQTSSASGVWPLVIARVVSVLSLVAAARATGTTRRPASIGLLAVPTGVLGMVANVLFLLAAREGCCRSRSS